MKRYISGAARSTGSLASALIILGIVTATSANAEPVLDRALQSVQILNGSPGCDLIRVSFNYRIRYAGNFPQSSGSAVRISVRAIDPAEAVLDRTTRRESVTIPESAAALLKAIELDLDLAGGPALVVQFAKSVHFEVREARDFESLIIAIAHGKQKSCHASEAAFQGVGRVSPPPRALNTTDDRTLVKLPAPRSKARTPGPATKEQQAEAEAAMDEARGFLKKGNFAKAIERLNKILALPETTVTAEAQEFLGVARQRGGDLAEAAAEFEDYLTRYPAGEGTDRVRQRLAAVRTAEGKAQPKLKDAKDAKREARRETGSSWTVSGSASQFYIRDDSFHVVHDPSLPPDFSNPDDDHRVHQNELLSSIDLVATYSDAAAKWKFRFSGAEEHFFEPESDELASVAALFLETTVRDWGTMLRLGRQTRNTGGVLGRFDGGLVSYRANDHVTLNAVAGSPVQRRSDEPFEDDKWFVGTSVDYAGLLPGLDASVFFIEQWAQTLIDREAIGLELRYLTPSLAAFATVDYDLHFSEFNAAVASGTYTFSDQSTVHLGGEYRKAPYLSAWSALQGQPFITLYDMLKVHTQEEIDQLALDRTATYEAMNAGGSFPVNKHLQLSGDVTVSKTSGTISSGGVDAMPSTGTEVFYSAQLSANDIIAPDDMFILGLRLADREESNFYVVDINTRYPITPDLRFGPRVRFGYRDGEGIDLTEYSILPSLLVNYFVTKDMNFEIEAGAKWTETQQAGVTDTETELFLTAGYRYQFYADGQSAR